MFMKVPPKEAAAQADVWSFGVSLYSAVCGVTPYTNIDEVFEPRFRRKFDEKRGDLQEGGLKFRGKKAKRVEKGMKKG